MWHRIKPYEDQCNHAVDRNDPTAEVTAIEIQFPKTFSKRAWRVIRYFDGTMYLYVYKGKFVVTDESLELTEYGNGTHEAPFGAPRWTGNSLNELERWLEGLADEYDAADYDIAGWKKEPRFKPTEAEWHELSPNVLVTLVQSSQFIAVKTYCRKYGSHGRFLVYQSVLRDIMESSVGAETYESDCGDYVKITRLEDSLQFSFAWLSTYGDGSVRGFRQDITVPLLKIRLALDWSESVKHLYTPTPPKATIDARPAARTICEIVKDKRLRRAFSKAMRDCFRWPGEQITLFPDGKYSFFFTTKSGFPKNGGLILHESTKEGRPYIYYSVHT